MAKIRIPDEAMKYFRLTGSMGGKVRAERYSKQQLSDWARKGGRPRKEGKTAKESA